MVFHHEERQTKDVLLLFIYYLNFFDIMKAILSIEGGGIMIPMMTYVIISIHLGF